jgi:glycosyltransferase involved in cell wall biosynthesis
MAETVAGLVSVIMPVFNGERYLAAAIASVLAQAYTPWELIVVDDGSADASARIARNEPAARCLVQRNQGNGAAKNTGLAAARGEFLAFLDQDDLWLPGKLSAQVAALRQHPAAGFTTGRMAYFFEPGVSRPDWVPAEFLTEPPPAWLPSGLLIRRAAFDQIGQFDPTLPLCNDLDWLARARDAGLAAVVTPAVVMRRRVHGGNVSYRAAERARELARIVHGSTRRKRPARAGADTP